MSHVNPAVYKGAIVALEAQRAAYQRYARMVEAQNASLGSGDADRVAQFAESATQELGEIEQGARQLEPQLDQLRSVASREQMHEIRRMLDDLARDAREAEISIQNLTTQLEAWRDEYGRQLGELGVALPGTEERKSYGTRQGAKSYLLDRKG
jgi:small-conductance mechanosensitive channel